MFDSLYTKIVLLVTIVMVIAIIFTFSDFTVNDLKKSIWSRLKSFINTFIRNQESNYREKMTKGEMPKILYDYNVLMGRLKLEIPVFNTFPLTQFKWLIYLFSFIVSLFISLFIFKNIALFPILFLIIIVTTISAIFSMTIKNRLQRIIDCIETENILAASLCAKESFLSAIKQNLRSLPPTVRNEYKQYIDNIEVLTFSSREALQILDLDTGNFSTDFLSNVNILENHYSDGFENTFKDTAELNNLKKLARNKMDEIIGKISKDFAVAIGIAYGSLAVEMLACKMLSNFYLNMLVGQIIFILDLLIAAFMYLIVNKLKATEL